MYTKGSVPCKSASPFYTACVEGDGKWCKERAPLKYRLLRLIQHSIGFCSSATRCARFHYSFALPLQFFSRFTWPKLYPFCAIERPPAYCTRDCHSGMRVRSTSDGERKKCEFSFERVLRLGESLRKFEVLFTPRSIQVKSSRSTSRKMSSSRALSRVGKSATGSVMAALVVASYNHFLGFARNELSKRAILGFWFFLDFQKSPESSWETMGASCLTRKHTPMVVKFFGLRRES